MEKGRAAFKNLLPVSLLSLDKQGNSANGYCGQGFQADRCRIPHYT